MTAIQGLIFDKDGTLFDFQATWGAWVRNLVADLAAGDAARAAALAEALGYDLARGRFAPDSPVIADTPNEIAEALLPLIPGASPLTLVSRMNALAAEAPQVEAVSLVPFVEALKARGLHVGVVTNDGEVPARAHLGAAGVLGMLDFVAGFDSGHGAKPAPGQLLAFAEACGISPEKVVMVGDSRHDLYAARAAGMRGVGVLTGIAQEDELSPFAASVLPDIGHLLDWVDAQQALAAENAA